MEVHKAGDQFGDTTDEVEGVAADVVERGDAVQRHTGHGCRHGDTGEQLVHHVTPGPGGEGARYVPFGAVVGREPPAGSEAGAPVRELFDIVDRPAEPATHRLELDECEHLGQGGSTGDEGQHRLERPDYRVVGGERTVPDAYRDG